MVYIFFKSLKTLRIFLMSQYISISISLSLCVASEPMWFWLNRWFSVISALPWRFGKFIGIISHCIRYSFGVSVVLRTDCLTSMATVSCLLFYLMYSCGKRSDIYAFPICNWTNLNATDNGWTWIQIFPFYESVKVTLSGNYFTSPLTGHLCKAS